MSQVSPNNKVPSPGKPLIQQQQTKLASSTMNKQTPADSKLPIKSNVANSPKFSIDSIAIGATNKPTPHLSANGMNKVNTLNAKPPVVVKKGILTVQVSAREGVEGT